MLLGGPKTGTSWSSKETRMAPALGREERLSMGYLVTQRFAGYVFGGGDPPKIKHDRRALMCRQARRAHKICEFGRKWGCGG